jgi:hypothetical protein
MARAIRGACSECGAPFGWCACRCSLCGDTGTRPVAHGYDTRILCSCEAGLRLRREERGDHVGAAAGRGNPPGEALDELTREGQERGEYPGKAPGGGET